MKKTMIALLLLITASHAQALSNNDLCGKHVKIIAERIRAIGLTNIKLPAKEIEFKGDLAGIQQLDGIYEVTFANNSTAELRLNQFCGVIEFRQH